MKFTFGGFDEYSRDWLSKERCGQLFFTRGLPRSGKSTFARKWLTNQKYSLKDMLYDNKYKELYFPLRRVIVCGDDFRLATYGQEYDRSCEFASALTMFTAIKALLKNHCVLFDETNSSEWSLRRIFEICPNAEYIDIRTEKKECLKRNNKKIAEFVFDRIENNLLNIDPEDIRKDYK